MPRRRLHDEYFRKAKADGYRARSAYKLIEIHERLGGEPPTEGRDSERPESGGPTPQRRPRTGPTGSGLIRAGDAVLDLGCAPGSWVQVAAELTGPGGVIVGLDILPMEPGLARRRPGRREPETHLLQQDIREADAGALLQLAGGPFDVVMSDMAPNTTGAAGNTDHVRSVELCFDAAALARETLRRGGSICLKVFDGETLPELQDHLAAWYAKVRHIKPRATRGVSKELYLVGLGFEQVDLRGSRKAVGGKTGAQPGAVHRASGDMSRRMGANSAATRNAGRESGRESGRLAPRGGPPTAWGDGRSSRDAPSDAGGDRRGGDAR